MDPLQFLLREHQATTAALGRIEAASPAERGLLWSRFKTELRVHEQVEDACLYHPLARDVGSADPTLVSWEWRHTEEARLVDGLVTEMDRLDVADPSWLHRMRRIRARLEAHLAEEEQRIWPRVGHIWDVGRREQAGLEMERMRAERLGVGVAR
jgi:Hemerythrin HHE cation binding domain